MNRKIKHTAIIVVGLAGLLVLGGVALPRLMGPRDSEMLAAASNVEARLAAEHAALAERAEAEAAAAAADAEAEAEAARVAAANAGWQADTADEELVPSADGGLNLTLELRWTEYPATAPIDARVVLHNLSLETFHVPAPGEPQPTLTVVVATEDGEEVRRIVEGASEELVRRTSRLESDDRVALLIDIVAPGEEALPAGTYTAFAEYRSDPSWKRLGLPMWTSRRPAVYSPRVSFVVTHDE